jgi:hypothetical protein
MKQCTLKSLGYIGWSWHGIEIYGKKYNILNFLFMLILGNGRGECNSDLAPLNIVTGDAQIGSTW